MKACCFCEYYYVKRVCTFSTAMSFPQKMTMISVHVAGKLQQYLSDRGFNGHWMNFGKRIRTSVSIAWKNMFYNINADVPLNNSNEIFSAFYFCRLQIAIVAQNRMSVYINLTFNQWCSRWPSVRNNVASYIVTALSLEVVSTFIWKNISSL